MNYVEECIDILCKNQLLHNEACSDSSADADTVKRISISLVKKVFRSLVIWDIVSVQPLKEPTGLVYGWKEKEPTEEIRAITKKLRCFYNYDDWEDKDREVDIIDTYARDISNDINREVFTNLRNNVGTLSAVGDSSSLWARINQIKEIIKAKIGNFPNWIITNRPIGRFLRGEVTFGSEDICKMGFVNDMTLFEDVLFPDEVLLGYKGNEFESSFIYAPYVPISLTSPILDPDSFSRRGFLTRYGKKLLVGGGDWFGRIKVNNFPKD